MPGITASTNGAVADRGLIHFVDRNVGYDILEFTG